MLCQATENTTGKEPASEAYRQVSYVNDVTRANEQALVEYVTNGALGNSAISYTYGVQRESYAMTQYAATAGGITEALTSHSSGIYYYTGTGSVSNLISSGGNYAYTYSEYGARTVYRTGVDGYTDVTAISDTCESYGYNEEYTHETLGVQYLRARYYSIPTGTFTSRDTYAGRIESILSQNRYTYAENNPVNYADPSGHAKKKGGLPSLQKNMWIANGGNGPAYKQPVNNPAAAAKAAYQKRREDLGLPEENTLLDNARVYNGQEYYNNLVLNTSISALMSPIGGSHTFAESIAAKVEAAMCQAYAQCKDASYNNQNITFDWELYEENKFYRMTAEYIQQIQNDELTDEQKRELQEIREAYLRNKDRYEKISQESGFIPPEVIAAIHYRENATDFLNGGFNVYLHNGDPLGTPSPNVPYPDFGKNAFDEAALDALRGWDGISNYKEDKAQQLELTPTSRDLTAMVAFTGLYQGWQSGVSNYVYSGTSLYQSGVYVADHVYDENVVDQNYGTYLVLKTLLE